MIKEKLIIMALLVVTGCNVNDNNKINTLELGEAVLQKGMEKTDLGTYQGSLLLQGMTELAMVNPDKAMLDSIVSIYEKFGSNEIEGRGSFISYKAGGNGAAYLKYKNATTALDSQVVEAANRMYTTQKRSTEGVITANWAAEETDQVFIDMAFAVTPFMLYAGLSEQNNDYIDLAVFETFELFKILRDNKTNLLHQARGFNGLGSISEDNWSRGNGWGALALATLVRDLPESHRQREEVEAVAKEFFNAVIDHQNEAGLWHQEMTDINSYTETSGSGLLLYGLGIMLEKGLLDKQYQDNFLKGISSLTGYVATDGSVSHACYSCLSPRKGTKDDYSNHPWIFNDSHAFGPVVLAFAQAAKMGFMKIDALEQGKFAVEDTVAKVVRTYVKYVPERNQDISWENDRIGFRYFGPPVRDKVSSGIDVWAKSVDYSILDKWYRLNARGEDYHVDRGEGGDFYNMGRLRGSGGSAIWKDNRPFAAETYDNHRILINEKDKIEFDLYFKEWDVDGLAVSEKKKIEMVNGTNFFQVTSTINADSNDELIYGIGLTTFGDPKLIKAEEMGLLSSWDKIEPSKPSLGTAVFVDPDQFVDFAQSDADQYVLVKVKPGQPFTYYAGAGWEGNKLFAAPNEWENYLTNETSWEHLNKIYQK